MLSFSCFFFAARVVNNPMKAKSATERRRTTFDISDLKRKLDAASKIRVAKRNSLLSRNEHVL